MRAGAKKENHFSDVVTFEIDDIAFGGSGVGRLDGVVCFIKGVLLGEHIQGRVIKKKSRFWEVELLEVKEQSLHRVEPPCPYFLQCGGCAYQHVEYSQQLVIKSKQLHDALKRIAGIENPPLRSMVPSPQPFYYRNRITVHVRHGDVGFFKAKDAQLIPIDTCLLASKEVNSLLAHLKLQRPPDGDYLLGEKQHYGGFRQVNNEVAKLLLEEVRKYILRSPRKFLIDAYCGAGFFSHAFAPYFSKIFGIERSRGSISLARREAAFNEVFQEGSVEELLPQALDTFPALATILILDPPSEGLSQLVLHAILNHPPSIVIYISCNPTTLARDLKHLLKVYQLEESTPLDMFPQTAEIESVHFLKKQVDVY